MHLTLKVLWWITFLQPLLSLAALSLLALSFSNLASFLTSGSSFLTASTLLHNQQLPRAVAGGAAATSAVDARCLVGPVMQVIGVLVCVAVGSLLSKWQQMIKGPHCLPRLKA